MRWKIISYLAMTTFLTVGHTAPPQSVQPVAAGSASLAEFSARAAKFNSVITLPTFETAPDQIALTLTNTIRNGNAALDNIGKLNPRGVTFDNTLRALDNL